jgi:DNA-binding transcriptional regulator YdaS (Cro superfamily)
MEHDSTPVVALARAVSHAGSQAAFARLIGVTQQAVSKWTADNKPLPHMHVLKVEAETGISRHELRPDLYPIEEAPSTFEGYAREVSRTEPVR